MLSLPRSETLSQQDVGWDNAESASSAALVTWEILQLSLHFNATSESELGGFKTTKERRQYWTLDFRENAELIPIALKVVVLH